MAASTTFTPQTFAKLSPHPFLLANLQPEQDSSSTTPTAGPSRRTNGRAPREIRPLHINASSLSHAHGSAMVRIGDTSVICGVRGEILPATSIPQFRAPQAATDTDTDDDNDDENKKRRRDEAAREMRDYDLLVPNIELATGCAPQFLPGAPPGPLAQTLSTRVYSLLHSAGVLDGEQLRIWHSSAPSTAEEEEEEEGAKREVRAYWTLYIDVLFVSLDGNAFDAAWVAVLAALRHTSLPRAWWDADREMVLCSRTEGRALTLAAMPVACTAVVLSEREMEGKEQEGKTWLLADPDRLEEGLCQESVTVVVDKSQGETRIRGISKAGGRVLGPEAIKEVVGLAEERWDEFAKVSRCEASS